MRASFNGNVENLLAQFLVRRRSKQLRNRHRESHENIRASSQGQFGQLAQIFHAILLEIRQ